MGLGQLNQANLHPARHEFKRRPTQSNLSPIGATNQKKFAPNQKKFAPNPSPIRIRIPDCASVSIFDITFDLNVVMIQVGLESKLKGLQLCSLPKVRILKLNGLKSSVK